MWQSTPFGQLSNSRRKRPRRKRRLVLKTVITAMGCNGDRDIRFGKQILEHGSSPCLILNRNDGVKKINTPIPPRNSTRTVSGASAPRLYIALNLHSILNLCTVPHSAASLEKMDLASSSAPAVLGNSPMATTLLMSSPASSQFGSSGPLIVHSAPSTVPPVDSHQFHFPRPFAPEFFSSMISSRLRLPFATKSYSVDIDITVVSVSRQCVNWIEMRRPFRPFPVRKRGRPYK